MSKTHKIYFMYAKINFCEHKINLIAPRKKLQDIKKRKNLKNLFLVLAKLPLGPYRFADKK